MPGRSANVKNEKQGGTTAQHKAAGSKGGKVAGRKGGKAAASKS